MIDLELAKRLGDRHLRLMPDGSKVETDQSPYRSVCITADEAVASTAGGQHLLWMLSNLLARQFAIVHEVLIAVPEVPALNEAFFTEESELGSLPDALVNTIIAIGGTTTDSGLAGVVAAKKASASAQASVEIIVGSAKPACPTSYRLYCYGDGWSVFVGLENLCPDIPPRSSLAFGPYFAACIAAGEAYKHLLSIKKEKYRLDSVFLDLWTLTSANSWHELPIEPKLPDTLPHFYLVGAGAVGQAVAATVGASRLPISHITIIDHDKIDKEGTNLNRCVLSYFADREQDKCEIVQRALQISGIPASSCKEKWQGFVRDTNCIFRPLMSTRSSRT